MLGEQQQHQHVQLPDSGEHALLLLARREEHVLRLRPDRPKHRRTQQQPCQQRSHHGGLSDPSRRAAEELPDENQKDDVGEKSDVFECLRYYVFAQTSSRAARAGRQKEAETGEIP